MTAFRRLITRVALEVAEVALDVGDDVVVLVEPARTSGQVEIYGPHVPTDVGHTSLAQVGLQMNSVQQSTRCTVTRS